MVLEIPDRGSTDDTGVAVWEIGDGMSITPSKRYAVLSNDKFRCHYCGAKAGDVQLEVDHVIPRSKGGSNSTGNLVAACPSCNQGKGDTVDDIELEYVSESVLASGISPVQNMTKMAEDKTLLRKLMKIWPVCRICGDEIEDISCGVLVLYDRDTGGSPTGNGRNDNTLCGFEHITCEDKTSFFTPMTDFVPNTKTLDREIIDAEIADWCRHIRTKLWYSPAAETRLEDGCRQLVTWFEFLLEDNEEWLANTQKKMKENEDNE